MSTSMPSLAPMSAGHYSYVKPHPLRHHRSLSRSDEIVLIEKPTLNISVANVLRQDFIAPQRSINYTQKLILIGVILANTGVYHCKTNITICLNMVLRSLPGVDMAQIGAILSLGYFFYAAGKLFQGMLMDLYGGRWILIIGISGAIMSTLLIANLATDYDTTGSTIKLLNSNGFVRWFGLLWCLNRLFQSGTWGAIVFIIGKTFPSSMHGFVLGIASTSYGLGDVLVRIILGATLAIVTGGENSKDITPIDASKAWRSVFFVAVAGALFFSIPAFSILIGTRSFVGDMTVSSPVDHEHKVSLHNMIKTVQHLFALQKFWFLIILSFCLTFLRETIIIWTASFMISVGGMSDGDAAIATLLFPLFGTVSTVIGGYLMDSSKPINRGRLLVFFLIGLTSIFGLVASYGIQNPTVFQTVLCIIMISLFLLAPFSFVDGILSLNLSGPHGAGLTLSIINAAGYIGAILAGHQIGNMADEYGWEAVLRSLWVVSLISLVTSILYWIADARPK